MEILSLVNDAGIELTNSRHYYSSELSEYSIIISIILIRIVIIIITSLLPRLDVERFKKIPEKEFPKVSKKEATTILNKYLAR